MRVFDNFPEVSICPICGTNKNEECWLMVIDGTQDGNNIQAQPVHVSCTGRELLGRMRFNKEVGIVYAFIEN